MRTVGALLAFKVARIPAVAKNSIISRRLVYAAPLLKMTRKDWRKGRQPAPGLICNLRHFSLAVPGPILVGTDRNLTEDHMTAPKNDSVTPKIDAPQELDAASLDQIAAGYGSILLLFVWQH